MALGMIISANAREHELPNIIFILADDMGYSDMSWQGSPIQTPNLDKLAQEGMFLSRNYVQPQCTPTRIAFLTGNYPYRYGLHEHVLGTSSMKGIPSGEKTIAEKMKEGGYFTSIIGKWHAGVFLDSYLPHNLGFDHSFVCIHGHIDYWNYTVGDRATVIRNGDKFYAAFPESGEESGNTYATDLWKDEAVDIILNHNKVKPLFMYLPFNAPHAPFQAPSEELDKYSDIGIDAYWSGPDAALGRDEMTRRIYMAMVDAMDDAIGGVLEALVQNNMLDNTLVVFCSDNGGIPQADNRPLRSYKGDAFEGGVRVPGIAFWPGKIQPGSTSEEMVYVADWYATFAEIAGMDTDGEDKDGISALDALTGGKAIRDHLPIISAGRHAYITPGYSLVGSGENYQKILNQDFSDFRLYDLKNDISQEEPVVGLDGLRRDMKDGLKAHFYRTQRGFFNWDAMYARYRAEQNDSDHDLDMVRDDDPGIKVTRSGSESTVSISPVYDEMAYTLQRTLDGDRWTDMGTFVCREDADEYLFPGVEYNRKAEYRVLTDYHFGLPIHDPFSLESTYEPGPLKNDTHIDGFLPISNVTGGEKVRIIEESLEYGNHGHEGGALMLLFDNLNAPPSLTRYFIAPLTTGRVYASMLLEFEGMEEECTGEVNWLVQNGWNGETEKQASLQFHQDGIYIDKADPLPPHTRTWLSEHGRNVVFVLFEFDLGPIGQDVLKVHINPSGKPGLAEPQATLEGEFTFDRLQFKLTARPGSTLMVDEIRIGRNLSDVMDITPAKQDEN